MNTLHNKCIQVWSQIKPPENTTITTGAQIIMCFQCTEDSVLQSAVWSANLLHWAYSCIIVLLLISTNIQKEQISSDVLPLQRCKICPQNRINCLPCCIIRRQWWLPCLHLIFSLVPVAAHPFQCRTLCCYDVELFLDLQDKLHYMRNFFMTHLLYIYKSENIITVCLTELM